jgi:DNA invertase Pin-like site-specific DNA recombinase
MEPFFDSCGNMRDVVISIMATLAEQERISISDRTKAGLARKRAKSTVLGRRAVGGNASLHGQIVVRP